MGERSSVSPLALAFAILFPSLLSPLQLASERQWETDSYLVQVKPTKRVLINELMINLIIISSNVTIRLDD